MPQRNKGDDENARDVAELSRILSTGNADDAPALDARRQRGGRRAAAAGDSGGNSGGGGAGSSSAGESAGNGNIGEIGAADNDDGIESFDLDISDARDRRANDPTRRRNASGSRARGRGRDSRRAGADQATGAAAEDGTSPDSGAVPREVAYESLGKSKSKASAKDSALSLEFFAEGWALAFHAAGTAFRDSETWKLPEDDANELAERTQAWLGSLDAKRFASVQKKIAKWQPALSLGMGLIAVIGPRIAETKRKKNAVVTPSRVAQSANGNGNGARAAATAAPVAPVATVARDMVAQSPNGRTADYGQAVAVERPFRREDWHELFGPDDGGAV